MENPEGFVNDALEHMGEYTGPNENILVPVSGGTDSRIVAELWKIGVSDKRVYPAHINHGGMRRFSEGEESELVARQFGGFSNFRVIDAREDFYEAVMGIKDSEEKRKAFKHGPYAGILGDAAKKCGCDILSDGTIGPDRKETVAGWKDQHNIGLKYGVKKRIEPLLCRGVGWASRLLELIAQGIFKGCTVHIHVC